MRISYKDQKGRRVSKVGAAYIEPPIQDYKVEIVTEKADKIIKRSVKKKDVESKISGSLPELNIMQENKNEQ